jgi:multimeric flavodoxin WrbA
MKRVFAYIGSPHGERSNTYHLTSLFLDALRKKMDIECRIVTPTDTEIRYCTGCWTCMTKGACPQDESDDMKRIREAMTEADLIILGTPVYIMNVSGQMKTFLDRLPAWFHTFRLAGKMGVTVVTTGGGGLEEVQQYLGMLMVPLGIRRLGELGAFGDLPGVLYDEEKARNDAEHLAGHVYHYLADETWVTSDETFEAAFSMMKSAFGPPGNPLMKADSRYWEEHGLSACETYEDFLKTIRRPKDTGI